MPHQVALAARRAERHPRYKRLMLLALLSLSGPPAAHLVGAAVGQWPAFAGSGAIIGLALPMLLPFASAIHDWVSQRRIHPVSLWVPLVLFFAAPRVVLPSSPWREFTAWLLRLG